MTPMIIDAIPSESNTPHVGVCPRAGLMQDYLHTFTSLGSWMHLSKIDFRTRNQRFTIKLVGEVELSCANWSKPSYLQARDKAWLELCAFPANHSTA